MANCGTNGCASWPPRWMASNGISSGATMPACSASRHCPAICWCSSTIRPSANSPADHHRLWIRYTFGYGIKELAGYTLCQIPQLGPLKYPLFNYSWLHQLPMAPLFHRRNLLISLLQHRFSIADPQFAAQFWPVKKNNNFKKYYVGCNKCKIKFWNILSYLLEYKKL